MSLHDRRFHERYALTLPAFVLPTAAQQKDEARFLLLKDISSTGAFFHTGAPTEIGTELMITLILDIPHLERLQHPRLVRLQMAGRVVRRESQGMAVCFDQKVSMAPLVH